MLIRLRLCPSICFWLGHSCAQGFSNKTGSGREHAEDDGQDERAQITVAAPFRDLLLPSGRVEMADVEFTEQHLQKSPRKELQET